MVVVLVGGAAAAVACAAMDGGVAEVVEQVSVGAYTQVRQSNTRAGEPACWAGQCPTWARQSSEWAGRGTGRPLCCNVAQHGDPMTGRACAAVPAASGGCCGVLVGGGACYCAVGGEGERGLESTYRAKSLLKLPVDAGLDEEGRAVAAADRA